MKIPDPGLKIIHWRSSITIIGGRRVHHFQDYRHPSLRNFLLLHFQTPPSWPSQTAVRPKRQWLALRNDPGRDPDFFYSIF